MYSVRFTSGSVSKDATRLLRGFSKKFHEPDSESLCMPKMFLEGTPSTMNLKATEGVNPSEASLKFYACESRMMTVSDPLPRIPGYTVPLSLGTYLTLATKPCVWIVFFLSMR